MKGLNNMNKQIGNELVIWIYLYEEQAFLNGRKPGWNAMDCHGDTQIKESFLKYELEEIDLENYCIGIITDHCKEVIDQIGGLDQNCVDIFFNRDTRQYQIDVVER